MSKELCRSVRPLLMSIQTMFNSVHENKKRNLITSGHNREKTSPITFFLALFHWRKVKLTLFLFYLRTRRPSYHIAGHPFDNSSFSTEQFNDEQYFIHIRSMSDECECCVYISIHKNERKRVHVTVKIEEKRVSLTQLILTADIVHMHLHHITLT